MLLPPLPTSESVRKEGRMEMEAEASNSADQGLEKEAQRWRGHKFSFQCPPQEVHNCLSLKLRGI